LSALIKAEVAVIGGGSAGAIAAHVLSRLGRNEWANFTLLCMPQLVKILKAVAKQWIKVTRARGLGKAQRIVTAQARTQLAPRSNIREVSS
jgi:hypothetical protein